MKNFKYGFSFAEVMITLVVIGVIAMVVVPNLLDNTTQRVNLASASKADLEVHQAALRIQGECIRWRCEGTVVRREDGSEITIHVYDLLANYLRNNGENLQYKIQVGNGNTLKVLVNVENDNSTNVAYDLNSDGTVSAVCSLRSYKEGQSVCNTAGYTWPENGADGWRDGLPVE